MGLPGIHRQDVHRQDHSVKPNYPQLSRKYVARRISEGETGRLKEELKCECGKGYKHVSSLAKHLWEHTPEWNVTSKLLISKHQQVQLLEAASILVSMNEEDEEDDADTPQDDSAVFASPQSSGQTPSPEPQVKSLTPAAEGSAAVGEKHEKRPAEDRQLTPARDIPVLSNAYRPIGKQARSNRRRSSAAGSLGMLSGTLSGSLDRRHASPLPESLLAKEFSGRRRRPSTLVPSSVPRESGFDADDDGLQDPHDLETPRTPKTPKFRKEKKEDVFGMDP